MRLIVIISLICVFQSYALNAYAQNTKMSISVEQMKLVDILNKIENESKYRFAYNKSEIDVEKSYTLQIEDADISKILETLLTGSDINYSVINRQIVLSSSNAFKLSEQKIKLSGKVIDTSGQPLPGVTVVVKGTTNGTITNFDGVYTLSDVPSNGIIQFSFVGMKMQEIAVDGKTSIDVTLEEDAIGIEEVVAVGYGTMKKSDLTGAVSSVRVEDMDKIIKTNVDQALQGMAAGVLVTQNSAQPGGGISMRIRGVTSLSAGNEPLYVVDGIPIDANEGSDTGTNDGPSISPLSMLNPEDIQSIEILKDASSTAIYGSRGSNGVVLITTKQGKSGDGKITFTSSFGFENISYNMDLLNAQEFMEVANLTLLNDNDGDESLASQDTRWFSEAKKDSVGDGINWLDEILRTGVKQSYQLSASGGKNSLRYYMSLSYLKNDGVVKNSDFERTSFRINLSNQFTDNFSMGGSISFSDINSNFIRTEGIRQNAGVSSVMHSALIYNPTRSVYEDSTDNEEEFYIENSVSNPVSLVENVTNATIRRRLIGNVYLEYELLKDLTLKSTGTFNYGFNRDNYYAPQVGTYNGSINRGIARLGYADTKTLSSINQVNYSKKLGKHKINALGVFEVIQSDSYQVKDQVTGFVNDILRENDMKSGSNASNPDNYKSKYSLVSFLSRLNYNYDNKYLVTVSGRYDGSSRFGVNNKFAFFPSASFGWNMAREGFLNDISFINQLKLRASYGVSGNQSIPLYSSTSPLESKLYIWGGSLVTGYSASHIANPDLKWERKEQMNLGLDFSFLKSRLSGSIEYFNDITNDLLLPKTVPTSSGFTSMTANIGSLKNSGIELTINSINCDKMLKWRTSFNISFPKTIVRSLGEDEYLLAGYSNSQVSNSQIIQAGEPIGQFYGYVFDGIAQTEEDVAYTLGDTWIGDYKYKDISGPDGVPDGSISSAYDKTVIGNALPEFFGGITNTFSYKGFELSIFFQGTYGNDLMNLNRVYLEHGYASRNQLTTVLDSWTPENTDAKIRKLTYSNSVLDANSNLVEDGSYLRLKNITMTYNLPKNIISALKISNAQLSVSGQNLLTFTNYSGIDPEANAGRNNSFSFGHDLFGYPQSKIITTGISVTF